MMVKVLDLVNLGGETPDLLLSCLLEVLQKLDLEKVIIIAADNSNVNLSGRNRREKNSLYYRLQ
jgi:hypothetical protein